MPDAADRLKGIDVLILATKIVEYNAALKFLQENEIEFESISDTFMTGALFKARKDGFALSCALLHANDEQGHVGISVFTNECLHKYHPRYIMMVGMLAMVVDDVKIGTVYFAESAVLRDLGEVEQDGGYKWIINNQECSSIARTIANNIKIHQAELPFKVSVSVVASGNQVLERPTQDLKNLVETVRKLDANEMEIASFYHTVNRFNRMMSPMFPGKVENFGAWKGGADHMNADDRGTNKYANQVVATKNAMQCIYLMLEDLATRFKPNESEETERRLAQLLDFNVSDPLVEDLKDALRVKHQNNCEFQFGSRILRMRVQLAQGSIDTERVIEELADCSGKNVDAIKSLMRREQVKRVIFETLSNLERPSSRTRRS